MNDDDDDVESAGKVTPQLLRRQPRFAMPDGERDGAAHRRAVTESERRRHAEMYASGMPVVIPDPAPDPDTGPVAMLEAVELDAEEYQQVHRLRRESPDPFVGMYKLAKQNRALRKELQAARTEERSNNEQRANQLLELLNRPPDERTAELERDVAALRSELAEVKRDVSPLRAFSKWALGVAGGAALAVAIFLYQRGFGEGSAAVRLEVLERTVGQLWRATYPDSKGHAP